MNIEPPESRIFDADSVNGDNSLKQQLQKINLSAAAGVDGADIKMIRDLGLSGGKITDLGFRISDCGTSISWPWRLRTRLDRSATSITKSELRVKRLQGADRGSAARFNTQLFEHLLDVLFYRGLRDAEDRRDV